MVIRSKQKLKISEPFNIVLVNPEIPPNTGNIARLCAATGSLLHLVHPLGFEINNKHLKRAGLDYWPLLDIKEYKDWEEFCNSNNVINVPQDDSKSQSWFISTRGEKNIWDVKFNPGDYLVFGSETKGLDEDILKMYSESVISIPMNGLTRSINLSTAVGVVLYEAIRQVTVERKIYEVLPV